MERDQALKFIQDLLRLMVSKNGSDLFITAGFPPAIKVDGKISPVSNLKLTPQHTTELARAIMNDRQASIFEATNECDFAISPSGIGRFRVNAFIQQARVGLVCRTLNTIIPTVEELNLPPILKDVAMSPRGLVIIVGATGAGKTTTLASMLGFRNENSQGHIITIEDPIEFIHEHRSCVITQREIGTDTESWEVALKSSMRQAPDVVQLGEVRDRRAMEQAIALAETGHLCLTTLHANNSNQAIDRIVNFFPEERRHQLLMDLSFNLRAMISQRLIPRKDGKGRIPAVEVMLHSPLMADMVFKGSVHELKDVIRNSRELGMQTFDQALFELYQNDKISYEDALRNADSLNDVRLQIKLYGKDSQDRDLTAGTEHLNLI